MLATKVLSLLKMDVGTCLVLCGRGEMSVVMRGGSSVVCGGTVLIAAA